MRKPIAVIVMLAFLAFWIWAAGTLGTHLTGLPRWVQPVFFIAAGIGWVLPMRPLLKWMNANAPPEED